MRDAKKAILCNNHTQYTLEQTRSLHVTHFASWEQEKERPLVIGAGFALQMRIAKAMLDNSRSKSDDNTWGEQKIKSGNTFIQRKVRTNGKYYVHT